MRPARAAPRARPSWLRGAQSDCAPAGSAVGVGKRRGRAGGGVPTPATAGLSRPRSLCFCLSGCNVSISASLSLCGSASRWLCRLGRCVRLSRPLSNLCPCLPLSSLSLSICHHRFGCPVLSASRSLGKQGKQFHESLGSLGCGFESRLPLPRQVTLTRHFLSLSRFLLCGSEKTHPGPGLSRQAPSTGPPPACPVCLCSRGPELLRGWVECGGGCRETLNVPLPARSLRPARAPGAGNPQHAQRRRPGDRGTETVRDQEKEAQRHRRRPASERPKSRARGWGWGWGSWLPLPAQAPSRAGRGWWVRNRPGGLGDVTQRPAGAGGGAEAGLRRSPPPPPFSPPQGGAPAERGFPGFPWGRGRRWG